MVGTVLAAAQRGIPPAGALPGPAGPNRRPRCARRAPRWHAAARHPLVPPAPGCSARQCLLSRGHLKVPAPSQPPPPRETATHTASKAQSFNKNGCVTTIMYRSNIRKNSRNEEKTNNRHLHKYQGPVCPGLCAHWHPGGDTSTRRHTQPWAAQSGGSGLTPPTKHPVSPRPPALRRGPPERCPHPRQCDPAQWQCPCSMQGGTSPLPPPPTGAGEEQGRQADHTWAPAGTGKGRVLGMSRAPRDTCPLPSHGLTGTWVSSASTGL